MSRLEGCGAGKKLQVVFRYFHLPLPRFLVFDKEQMFAYRDLIIRSGGFVCNTLFFSCTRLGTTTVIQFLESLALLAFSFVTAGPSLWLP